MIVKKRAFDLEAGDVVAGTFGARDRVIEWVGVIDGRVHLRYRDDRSRRRPILLESALVNVRVAWAEVRDEIDDEVRKHEDRYEPGGRSESYDR